MRCSELKKESIKYTPVLAQLLGERLRNAFANARSEVNYSTIAVNDNFKIKCIKHDCKKLPVAFSHVLFRSRVKLST